MSLRGCIATEISKEVKKLKTLDIRRKAETGTAQSKEPFVAPASVNSFKGIE